MMEKLPNFLVSGETYTAEVIDIEAKEVSSPLLLDNGATDPAKRQVLYSILDILSPWSLERLTDLHRYLEVMEKSRDEKQCELF